MKHSEETLAKMRVAQSNRKLPREHSQKIPRKRKNNSNRKGYRKHPRPNCIYCGKPVKEYYNKKGDFGEYNKTCGGPECKQKIPLRHIISNILCPICSKPVLEIFHTNGTFAYKIKTCGSKECISKLMGHAITLISPEGKECTFNTRKDAAKYIGCIPASMYKLAYGKSKSCYGWKVKI